MSTNQQRLKSAIQRIARSDPQIRSLLKAVEARGDIPATGAAASNNAEQDRQCCDGSVAGGGGSSGGGGSGGGSSDATVGTSTRTTGGGQNGLDSNNPANLDGMEEGSLDGLVDCETGVPVRFDGSDWIPPEGWDSPTEPGIDPSYQEGKYYRIKNPFGGITGTGPTKNSAIYNASMTPGGTLYGVNYDACYGATELGENDIRNGEKVCGGTSYAGGAWENVQQEECAEGSSEEYCNPSDDDTIMDSWPRDHAANLAVKNGAIVGSKYDPDQNGEYNKPRSEISLCDDDGNQVDIKPSASGGWKSINPAVNGGDGYMYNSSGKRIARISGNEYSDPNI